MTNKDIKSPLVSVIIPTFNRSKLLGRTIHSVLQQSYQNLEIIVVDDGSTDDTEQLVREISRKHPGLVFIKKNNGGCASARNKGLEVSTGDLIAFLDSDDVWLPDAVETLTAVWLVSGADLIYSPSYEVFRNGRKIINYPVASGNPENLAIEHFMDTNVRPGSFVFTREALRKTGFQDEGLLYNEDSDYFQRLAIGCIADYSPIPTLMHFHHMENKSSNRVEIYKALFKSSKKTINTYPAFAEKLGEKANSRLEQIKNLLIEALAISGDYSEAELVAGKNFNKLAWYIRFSILLRNNVLLKSTIKLQKFRRRFGMLFYRQKLIE
jgi:glycosyltransferase involved in cell wall biosynthesis